MATIKENRKNGKVVSYYFTVCLGRDSQGKQIRHYTTWTPPKGMKMMERLISISPSSVIIQEKVIILALE